MLLANSRVAVLAICTDPRFSVNPGDRFLQFREALRVDYVIPLARPGIVGLFLSRKNFLSGQNGFSPSDIQQDVLAWGRDFIKHFNMHHPCIVGVASHETCGGFKGNVKHQKKSVIIAAKHLQWWLQKEYNINISVVPFFEQRIADDRWRVHSLGEGVSQAPFLRAQDDAHSF